MADIREIKIENLNSITGYVFNDLIIDFGLQDVDLINCGEHGVLIKISSCGTLEISQSTMSRTLKLKYSVLKNKLRISCNKNLFIFRRVEDGIFMYHFITLIN